MSRQKNSVLNASSSIVIYFLKTIVAFATRTTFIYILGKDYLGLDSLMMSLVLMLSVAEMGISSAISFSLYEPLSNNNLKKVSAMMSLYKKAYFFVGFLILFSGLILSIFLPSIVNDISRFDNAYLIFYLFLANASLPYFISYKDILLNADQKTYKITQYSLASFVILSIAQITILLTTKNYVYYLLIGLTVNLEYRFIVNRYISRKYSTVSFNTKEQVDHVEKKGIIKNVKALFLHKTGDYVINGTDSLIIAKFIDIGTVGMYATYILIVTVANGLIAQIFNALTPSIGNLLITKNDDKSYRIFEQMNILNFIMSGMFSLLIAVCINDFILLWIGSEYILSSTTVILITISFFLSTMRISSLIVKSAAGLFDIDKYTPLIQSVINLVCSIVLVVPFGLNGVVLGTIISSVVLPSWQRPYIVYRYIFKRSSKVYFIDYAKYVIMLISSYLVLLQTGRAVESLFDSLLITLLLKATTTVIIFSSFLMIISRNNPLFKDVVKLLLTTPGRLLKRQY